MAAQVNGSCLCGTVMKSAAAPDKKRKDSCCAGGLPRYSPTHQADRSHILGFKGSVDL